LVSTRRSSLRMRLSFQIIASSWGAAVGGVSKNEAAN
jgi:hypothetical protein